MRTWYDLGVERRGRTAVGTSGLEIEEIARYLSALARGETPENPSTDEQLSQDTAGLIRLACDDLKAFYSEAATAQPGRGGASASSGDIADWFWSETEAGDMLLRLRATLSELEDRMISIVGKLLIVPYTEAHRAPR